MINIGPKIINNSLAFLFDAADPTSYSGSGNTWYDLSGNSNNGALINSPSYDSSAGGCFVFNGSDTYVSIASENLFDNTKYTKTAWIYTTTKPVVNMIICGETTSLHAFWLYNGKLAAGHNGNWFTLLDTNDMPINRWNHVAVTFDTINGWVMYLNGSSILTNANTSTFSNLKIAYVGTYTAGGYIFTGKIANASIYNKVLSASEILQNYTTSRKRFGV